MEGLYAIIGAAVGIIATGVVNYFLKRQELAHQKAEIERREWLQGIERLHSSVMECVLTSGLFAGEVARIRALKVTDDEKLKLFGVAIERFSRVVTTAASHQRLFLPELKPQWTKALQAGQQVTLHSGSYATYKIEGEEMERLAQSFSDACMDVVAVIEGFRADVYMRPKLTRREAASLE